MRAKAKIESYKKWRFTIDGWSGLRNNGMEISKSVLAACPFDIEVDAHYDFIISGLLHIENNHNCIVRQIRPVDPPVSFRKCTQFYSSTASNINLVRSLYSTQRLLNLALVLTGCVLLYLDVFFDKPGQLGPNDCSMDDAPRGFQFVLRVIVYVNYLVWKLELKMDNYVQRDLARN